MWLHLPFKQPHCLHFRVFWPHSGSHSIAPPDRVIPVCHFIRLMNLTLTWLIFEYSTLPKGCFGWESGSNYSEMFIFNLYHHSTQELSNPHFVFEPINLPELKKKMWGYSGKENWNGPRLNNSLKLMTIIQELWCLCLESCLDDCGECQDPQEALHIPSPSTCTQVCGVSEMPVVRV